ncbi:hypothetical protein BJ166DRAFT_66528 [Pestalotiopsis sp. NC0098]|nr:hypothetical protein BJ166DRAFT_66528 [Pestalotiopsis sp. NC0098]
MSHIKSTNHLDPRAPASPDPRFQSTCGRNQQAYTHAFQNVMGVKCPITTVNNSLGVTKMPSKTPPLDADRPVAMMARQLKVLPGRPGFGRRMFDLRRGLARMECFEKLGRARPWGTLDFPNCLIDVFFFLASYTRPDAPDQSHRFFQIYRFLSRLPEARLPEGLLWGCLWRFIACYDWTDTFKGQQGWVSWGVFPSSCQKRKKRTIQPGSPTSAGSSGTIGGLCCLSLPGFVLT